MNFFAIRPLVAIACGGTGGHLFPGLAIAEQLKRRDCDVALLVSPKEIDRQAVKSAQGMEVFTLPAVGLQNRNYFSFGRLFLQSFWVARKRFKERPPAAVLAMGGFTSAPPVLAARKFGAKRFLHESNTVPGKANRFLSRFVDVAFVGFPEAAAELSAWRSEVTGTPVRPQFLPSDGPGLTAADCRRALGLEPERPTVLVVGGSQGARGLNEMMLSALPLLKGRRWQWLHLTGVHDLKKVKAAYERNGIRAVVKPFLAEMELALKAATACVSRAGASSLAEIAAMRLPCLLVPLPTAADNHQYFNASAFERTDAARLMEQNGSAAEKMADLLVTLMEDSIVRSQIQNALARWHTPKSAEQIADHMLTELGRGAPNHLPSGRKSVPKNEVKCNLVT